MSVKAELNQVAVTMRNIAGFVAALAAYNDDYVYRHCVREMLSEAIAAHRRPMPYEKIVETARTVAAGIAAAEKGLQ